MNLISGTAKSLSSISISKVKRMKWRPKSKTLEWRLIWGQKMAASKRDTGISLLASSTSYSKTTMSLRSVSVPSMIRSKCGPSGENKCANSRISIPITRIWILCSNVWEKTARETKGFTKLGKDRLRKLESFSSTDSQATKGTGKMTMSSSLVTLKTSQQSTKNAMWKI